MDFNTLINLLIYVDELESETFLNWDTDENYAQWKQYRLLQKKLLRELEKRC